MKAIVRDIQVCGGIVVTNLEAACKEYLKELPDTDRPKLAFSVILPTGKVKHITIRQEENCVVAYGDFDGLPSMLDYVLEVTGAKCGEDHTLDDAEYDRRMLL